MALAAVALTAFAVACSASPAGTAPPAGTPSPAGTPPPAGTPEATNTPGPPVVAAGDWSSVGQAQTAFGFRLLQELERASEGDNVFISPSSIAFALAMTLNGAEAETKEAMARVLEVHGFSLDELNEAAARWLEALTDPGDGVDLTLANSIWYRLGVPVIPEFLERTVEYYASEVREADFNSPATVDAINAWVQEHTNGLIDSILDGPIDPDVIMYLINALYFHGLWTQPFDPELTTDGVFTLAGGAEVTVPMMSRTGSYRMVERDGFRAISLPYGEGERFSMVVLLPDEADGLPALVEGLTAEDWDLLIARMSRLERREVELMLPRFSLEYDVSLKDALTALGMGVAFEPYGANFEGMVPREWMGQENVYIGDVMHKTFLEVTEEGTEAAAVTAVEVRATSAGPVPAVFRVDRPFLTAIWDADTETVLFLGAIADPS
jgi:serine protease inhibitor